MDILASSTLIKVAVADVERNRSASKSNPSDSRETHRRNGQLAHTCVKRVSGVHPPLYEDKKGIVVRSASLNRKSNNETMKTGSLDELNYINRQIMKQVPNQVEAAHELHRFLNKNSKINRTILTFLYLFSFIFIIVFQNYLKKIPIFHRHYGLPIEKSEF